MRHVVGTQRDDIGRRALELSHQQVFVLVRHLTGCCARGVVQLLEAVFLSHTLADAVAQQEVLQCRAKGLCRREEHTAVADGVALHEVEDAIGVNLVVVVQTVTAQSAQQRDVLHLRDIADVNACGVAFVLDIELELRLLHIRCQVVHVLHHQRPVELLWIVRRILQCLDKQRLSGIGMVSSKLTHTVSLATIGELVGHSQHLVGLQSRLQRDIS